MGWSSGSVLMRDIIASLNEAKIDDKKRHIAYKGIIKAFENEDCDTLCECLGNDPIFDEVYKKLHDN